MLPNKFGLTLLLLCLSFIYLKAEPDTTLIRKHLDTSYLFAREDAQKGYNAAEVAFNLASKSKEYTNWQGKAMLQMAVIRFLYGDYDSCELQLNRAYKLLKNSDFKKDFAKLNRIQGILMEMHGKYSDAMAKFLETRDLYAEIGDSLGIADSYLSLGIVKHKIKRSPECLAAYQKAESIYKKMGAEIKLGATYNNIGSYFNNMHVYDTAIYYLKLSAEISEKYKNTSSLQSAYHNIGTNFRELGISDSAIFYYHLSLSLCTKADVYNSAITNVALASEHLRRNRYDSAKYYFNITIKDAVPHSYFKPIIEAYDGLYQIESDKENYKQALIYYAEFSRYSDSLEKYIYNEKLAEAESKYKNLEQQIEINDLKSQQEEKDASLKTRRRNNFFLLLAVIFFVVLSLLLFYSRKQVGKSRLEQRRINKDLETKKKELEENHAKLLQIMAEKDEILGVLAHDIRAPFSKIISLIEVFKLEERNEENMNLYLGMMETISVDALKLIQDMVDLSRIHQGNLFSQSLSIVEFDIKSLIEKQLSFYSAQIAKKDLKVDFRMESMFLIKSRKDYLERIMDNLLSNAIKYSPIGGLISISVKESDNRLKIGIKDNGQGFSMEDMDKLFSKFQRLSAQPTGDESSTGLGLYIAKKLTEAMQGEINLISKEGEGAHFEICIPMEISND